MTRTSTQSPSPSEEPDQPCPECSPPSKVGNNRGKCKTCNSYAARVRRAASNALAELHPRDYADLTVLAREHEYEKLMDGGTSADKPASGQA